MKNIFKLSIFLFCCLLLCVTVTVKAQTIQQLVFSELWNGTSGSPDTINWSASITDHSRNLITVGNTKTISQMADVVVVKYDYNGVLQWQQTFNNTNDMQDYGIAVTVDNSNNIFVAATSFNDSTNDYDYNILMYDEYGSLQWQTYYNGADSKYDVPTAIALDDSGNIIVTGTSYSNADKFDFATIKLDGSGTILWDEIYDYNGEPDIAAALVVLPMCRIIVTGGCGSSLFNWDIVAVRYDWAGGFVGASADTSVGYGFDRPTSMATDNSSHIYITGAAMNGGNYDMVLIKLDSSLQEIWTQYYDYGNALEDQANDIAIDANGNIFITGYITRASGLKNGYLLGYDNSGTIFLHKEEENSDNTEAENLKLRIQSYGQILTTGWKDGTVDKDIYISAFDESGNRTGYKENKGLFKGDDIPNFIQVINDTVYLQAKVAESDTTFTYMAVQYQMDSILNVVSPNGDEHGSVSFWENRGQIIDTDDSIRHDIKFYTNEGPSLYFFDDFYSYVITKVDDDTTSTDTLTRVDVEYGNRGATTNSLEKISPDFLNYYLAHCLDGITNVNGYKKLITKNVFDGIDAIYSWNGNFFNQRLVCNPNVSDPATIEIKFAGADSVTIDTSGNLFVHTALGIIAVPEPIAYQEDIDGTITTLGWNTYFVLASDTSVSFFTDSYDASKSLVIEMGRQADGAGGSQNGNLDWCTYYGGGDYFNDDYSLDVINDPLGNTYMTGKTNSSNFPITSGLNQGTYNGGTDGFVVKFDLYAVRQWSTFYGGNAFDAINSIAFNPNVSLNNLYACGVTSSSDFPTHTSSGTNSYNDATHSGIGNDAFILRFNSISGICTWATYFGGNGDDEARGIVWDVDGNIEVTGITTTTQGQVGCNNAPANKFPLCHTVSASAYYQTDNAGGQDLFFAKFTPLDHMVWSTFFGSSADDVVFEIAFDPYANGNGSNSIYATGSTLKTNSNGSSCGVPTNGDFPLCDMGNGLNYFQYGGTHPAFIVNFNLDGTLRWSTNFNNINVSNTSIYLPDYSGFQTISSNFNGKISVAGLSTTSGTNSCSPVTGAYLPICTPGGSYTSSTGELYVATFNTLNNELYWSTKYNNSSYSLLSPDDNASLDHVFLPHGLHFKCLDLVYDNNENLYIAGIVFRHSIETQQETGFYWQQDLWNTGTSIGSGLDPTDCFILGFNQSYGRFLCTHFGGGDNETNTSIANLNVPYRFDFATALSFNQYAGRYRSGPTSFLYLVGFTGVQPYTTLNFPLFDAGTQPTGQAYFYTMDNPLINHVLEWDGFIARFNLLGLSTTGIDKDNLNSQNKILIYPNPTNNDFTLLISSLASGNLQVEVLNVVGEKLIYATFETEKGENKFTIPVSQLSSGIYFVRVIKGLNIFTKKIVVINSKD